jgi:hypothetical protein
MRQLRISFTTSLQKELTVSQISVRKEMDPCYVGPSYHSMARLRAMDGEDGLQI